MIEEYIKPLAKEYSVKLLRESKPLGTAGSLHLLNDLIKRTSFVTNCDILINEDYSEIYKYHKKYNNELTIVASLKHYDIPYGILETEKEGKLVTLKEKPNLNYLINSGMYIIEPHVIREIPQNTVLANNYSSVTQM